MSRQWRYLLASLALSWVGLLLHEAEAELDELEARNADLEEQLLAARQVRTPAGEGAG